MTTKPRHPDRASVARAPRAACAVVLATLLPLALGASAQAAQVSFQTRCEVAQIAADENFICEVTLSVDEGEVNNYRAPDFKNLRALAERPSQSTQIQMGNGGVFRQTVYTWQYELAPEKAGQANIGAARIRVSGKEWKTAPVDIAITAATGAPKQRRGRGQANNPFGSLFGVDPFDDDFGADPNAGAAANGAADPNAQAGDRSFIRVNVSKPRVFLGEPVLAEWHLYLTEQPNKYQTLTEPTMDGFWMEELPVPASQRGLALQQVEMNGRAYLSAPILRRALFPLRAGKLAITPMRSEIARVDFFGRAVTRQTLSADKVEIEVMPLPTAGQPAGFDDSRVGKFELSLAADKTALKTGDAVTVKLVLRGRGNLRKVVLPELQLPPTMKRYDPKTDVVPDPNDPLSGTKTAEYLLLAETAGTAEIPAVAFAYFDPEDKQYKTAKTEPVCLEIVGAAVAVNPAAAQGGAAGTAVPARVDSNAGQENVLGADIRPLRSRAEFRRDLGTSFFQSRAFGVVVAVPPILFTLMVIVGAVSSRLQQDTERGKQRRLRRMMNHRLRAAEKKLEASDSSGVYAEIERVIRELLTAKLGRPSTGFARDELRAALLTKWGQTSSATRLHKRSTSTVDARSEISGTIRLGEGGVPSASQASTPSGQVRPPEALLADEVLSLLSVCEEARFAPGGTNDATAREALMRASDLLVGLEKLPSIAAEDTSEKFGGRA